MTRTGQDLDGRLNRLLGASGLESLDPAREKSFASYLGLILRWNAKTNLTAIRDRDGILSRHFVECIACARAIPQGVGTLLDFGSGAGFPGVPIAICRPEIRVTLAESQGKKAAFLQEVGRELELSFRVHSGRGEEIGGLFDCVTLRAVDKMAEAVGAAGKLLSPGGWLGVMTTEADLPALAAAAGECSTWNIPVPLPGSNARILALAQRLWK